MIWQEWQAVGNGEQGVRRAAAAVPHEGLAPVKPGVDLLETADGGAVFVWSFGRTGTSSGAGWRRWGWSQVATNAASQQQVADAFGVNDSTLRRWQRAYEQGGTAALVAEAKGPKRASR
ncbi:MAG: helix-turn-helix domain-containing protein [Egibacteraceae bacterium]